MKSIILLFILVSLSSCVTANNGKRGLSGINEKPSQKQTPEDYDRCVERCIDKGGQVIQCRIMCDK